MKKIIVTLIALVALSATAQESVTLRLKYNVGDKYSTKMEMVQDMPMMKNNTTMNMTTKINGIKDGLIETENSFDKIVIDADAQGQKIHYDSAMKESELSPTAKMMKQRMGNLEDTVVLMFFDELGDLKDTKIKSGNQAHLESFKNSSPVKFPKEAVKVGSTWKAKKSNNGVNSNVVYTVKSISSEEVTIDVLGNLDGVAKGDVKGTMVVDLKTGHTKKSTVDTTLSAQGMDMKIKVTITSSKK